MTTSSHLAQASEYLELAIISYMAAKSRGEITGWKQKHIERIDLLKRATAKVRADMQADAVDTTQEELVFG